MTTTTTDALPELLRSIRASWPNVSEAEIFKACDDAADLIERLTAERDDYKTRYAEMQAACADAETTRLHAKTERDVARAERDAALEDTRRLREALDFAATALDGSADVFEDIEKHNDQHRYVSQVAAAAVRQSSAIFRAALAQPAQAPAQPIAWINPEWAPGKYTGPYAPVTVFEVAGWTPLYVKAAQAPALPSVDDLAQYIRRINGHHKMESGALAESLVGWMRAQAPAQPRDAEAIAQLRHLIDDLTVEAPDPDYPSLTRRHIAPGKELMFSNMVNAVARLLSQAPAQSAPQPSTAEAVERVMWLAENMAGRAAGCDPGEFVDAERAALRSAVEALARGETK